MDQSDERLYRDTISKFLTVYRYLRGYSRRMHAEGLSGRKIVTLRHLCGAGPLAVGQIADYLYISDSSTSELIAWLEKKGLVTRSRSARDNRIVLVSVTPAGREIVARMPLGGIPLLRETLRSLPADRLERINAAMTDILHMLEIEYGL